MSDTSNRSKWRKVRTGVGALLLGTALGGGGTAWTMMAQADQMPPPPISLPPVGHQAGFATLVQKVQPAVVQITSTEQSAAGNQTVPQIPGLPPGWPFGGLFRGQNGGQWSWKQIEPESHALGSGFVIDPSGYIVTNNHVIDNARDIHVTLSNGDKYSAKVVGRDAKTDIALLKIDAGKPLPYVAFGDSSKELTGDWVVAVGNPYGLGGTVTAGIVSARGRNINEGTFDDFLQIDAPINPGNSGGPLFNQSGQVIGIDTAIYSPSGGSVGIGFAIPSNFAKEIVAQLRAHGKVTRGWLGIQMQPLTSALARAVGLSNDNGVLVDVVQGDSPAQRAKLQQGDVITAYDGKTVKNTRDLALDVAGTPAGKTATITVWRNGQDHQLNVTIGTQDQEKVAAAAGSNKDATKVGMTLEPLTAEERAELNIAPSVSGVVVANVTSGSKADDSGLQAGDIITRVDGDQVSSPAQVAHDIHAANDHDRKAIPLQIVRDGVTSYVGLELS